MSLIDERQDVAAIDFNRALDFCVWVLEKDGLRVAAFDHHKEGSGILRSLGLDEATWRRWFQEVGAATERRVTYQLDAVECAEQASLPHVTALHDRIEDAQARAPEIAREPFVLRLKFGLQLSTSLVTLAARALAAGRRAKRAVPVVPYPDALALWPGDRGIAEELQRMYMHYKEDRRAPRRRSWKSRQLLSYLASRSFREFYSRFVERRTAAGLPPIVCCVNYPGPVVVPLTSSIVVIGARLWDVDGPTFERAVEEAVSVLPGAAGA